MRRGWMALGMAGALVLAGCLMEEASGPAPEAKTESGMSKEVPEANTLAVAASTCGTETCGPTYYQCVRQACSAGTLKGGGEYVMRNCTGYYWGPYGCTAYTYQKRVQGPICTSKDCFYNGM